MPTPLDVEQARQKRLAREVQARRDAEEIELSVSAHYANDTECTHHCYDCCPAEHLLFNGVS